MKSPLKVDLNSAVVAYRPAAGEEGDALFHVARFEDASGVAQHVEDFQAAHEDI
ncbi:MAG: hypothetical protein ACKOB8_00370 [Mycobacterium sp.]